MTEEMKPEEAFDKVRAFFTNPFNQAVFKAVGSKLFKQVGVAATKVLYEEYKKYDAVEQVDGTYILLERKTDSD